MDGAQSTPLSTIQAVTTRSKESARCLIHTIEYQSGCRDQDALGAAMEFGEFRACGSVARASRDSVVYIGYNKKSIEELNVWAAAFNGGAAFPHEEVLST